MTDIVSYDPSERVVYFTGKDEPVEIHRNVSQQEFQEIEQAETYSYACMATPDRLLHILSAGTLFNSVSVDALNTLKEDVISLYEEFPETKSLVENSNFKRVRGYSDVIYKVKRPLENTFECIGIVGDLMTNSLLIQRYYLGKHDPYHIQHLVINTCAAIEHLGIVAVNRLDPESGGIDSGDAQYNVTKVFEQITDAGLHKPMGGEDEQLPEVSMADVLKLKEMRDLIAHKSLIQNVPAQEIPEGLQEHGYIYDESEVKDLTLISLKLQMLVIPVLVRFVHDHIRVGLEPYVDAIYQDQHGNPVDHR